jgi:hypothetical protein
LTGAEQAARADALSRAQAVLVIGNDFIAPWSSSA